MSVKKLGSLIFVTMLLSITGAVSARAQTSTPREVLIQAITKPAQRDEKQMTKETVQGLNLLFSGQAKRVGRPHSEVVIIGAHTCPAAKTQRLAKNPMRQFVRRLPGAPDPSSGFAVPGFSRLLSDDGA